MVALLWFGGIFSAIRKIIKYDEIHKPFQIEDDESGKVCEHIAVYCLVRCLSPSTSWKEYLYYAPAP